jgi:hypothetical protein
LNIFSKELTPAEIQEKIIIVAQSASLIFTVLFSLIGIIYINQGVTSSQAVSTFLLLAVSIAVLILTTIKQFRTEFLKLDEINKGVNNLAEKSYHLRTTTEMINKLHYSYINIPYTGKTITDFIQGMAKNFGDKLEELRNQGHLMNLDPRESFKLSTSMIERLIKDDEVKAISFLEHNKGEWRTNDLWQNYIDVQISAAKDREVGVERIFITEKKILDDYLQKDGFNVVKKHTKKEFEETHLNGYFLDKSFFSNHSNEVKGAIGHGFIIIDCKSQNERMVVSDFFLPDSRPTNERLVAIDVFPDIKTEEPRNDEYYIHRANVYFNEMEIENFVKSYETIRSNKKLDPL